MNKYFSKQARGNRQINPGQVNFKSRSQNNLYDTDYDGFTKGPAGRVSFINTPGTSYINNVWSRRKQLNRVRRNQLQAGTGSPGKRVVINNVPYIYDGQNYYVDK